MTKQADQNKKIAALITLLEDDDINISTTAMKELLKEQKSDLSEALKELQESENSLLRRRIHQLQAILKIRDNRNHLSQKLLDNRANLLEGIMEIHLLWYDRDNDEVLKEQLEDLLKSAENSKLKTLNDLAFFMKKQAFAVSNSIELDADSYCLGAVLDSKNGADILLCCLVQVIADCFEIECSIVARANKFYLFDNSRTLLNPVVWETEKLDNIKSSISLESMSVDRILRFMIYQLLLCAVTTSSYRYVFTINKTLKKAIEPDKD